MDEGSVSIAISQQAQLDGSIFSVMRNTLIRVSSLLPRPITTLHVNPTNHLISCSQEVIRLEALCKELYESQDAGVRSEAEKALVAFQNSPDSLGNCCGDK